MRLRITRGNRVHDPKRVSAVSLLAIMVSRCDRLDIEGHDDESVTVRFTGVPADLMNKLMDWVSEHGILGVKNGSES